MRYACDICNRIDFTSDNPFVKSCQRRPSDKFDMVCMSWGHYRCFVSGDGPYEPRLPRAHSTLYADCALATLNDLEEWIEGKDAAFHGYLFLT